MNRGGMRPVAWTEAYLMRKKCGDGDRSQDELRCIARVLEVALLYDQLNVALASFELLYWRAQLIMGARAHDAQHPQYAGSDFYVVGFDTDTLDPILQKKAMKSRTTQAESLAKVAEVTVKLPRGGKGGSPASLSLIFGGRLGRPCHRSFALLSTHVIVATTARQRLELALTAMRFLESHPIDEHRLSRLCAVDSDLSAIIELHVDLDVFDSTSVPLHVLERLAERCRV